MTLGILTGTYKVAADPKLDHVGQRATPKLTLFLVTNKSKKEADGTWKTLNTHWINGILWGPRAETLFDQLQKGSDIRVMGEPYTEEWEKDGEKRRRECLQIVGFDVMPPRNGGSVSQASQSSRQSSDVWGSSPSGSFGGDDAPPF